MSGSEIDINFPSGKTATSDIRNTKQYQGYLNYLNKVFSKRAFERTGSEVCITIMEKLEFTPDKKLAINDFADSCRRLGGIVDLEYFIDETHIGDLYVLEITVNIPQTSKI